MTNHQTLEPMLAASLGLTTPASPPSSNGGSSSSAGSAAKFPQPMNMSMNININGPPTRKRSSSKTQTNYNPINNTPISSLQSPPPETINELPVQELQKHIHVLKLASPGSAPSEYLKILSIPNAPESLKIGRQNTPKATNKITDGFFDSRVLSRNHAELYMKNNVLYLKDLKSSNGTFINDEKLEPFKEYHLKIGDKIDLGTTLESQVAHKKITCIVSEFSYISLEDYESQVNSIMSKGDLQNKRLELFNSSLDALIFGELIEDQEDNFLSDLLNDVHTIEKKSLKKDVKFIPGLTVKPSNNIQDIIRKLVISTNNEYLQQQRLKQIGKFLKNYNKVITKSSSCSLKLREVDGQSKESEKAAMKWQLAASKSEERMRKMDMELNMIRSHLSNSRSKEAEANRISEENARLKAKLDRKKKDLNELSARLEDSQRTINTLRHLETEFTSIQETNKKLELELQETNALLKSFSERDVLKTFNVDPTPVSKSGFDISDLAIDDSDSSPEDSNVSESESGSEKGDNEGEGIEKENDGVEGNDSEKPIPANGHDHHSQNQTDVDGDRKDGKDVTKVNGTNVKEETFADKQVGYKDKGSISSNNKNNNENLNPLPKSNKNQKGKDKDNTNDNPKDKSITSPTLENNHTKSGKLQKEVHLEKQLKDKESSDSFDDSASGKEKGKNGSPSRSSVDSTKKVTKSGSAKENDNETSKDSFLNNNKQRKENTKLASTKSETEEKELHNDKLTQTEAETKKKGEAKGSPNNAIKVVLPLTSITFFLAITILYTIYKDQLDTLLKGLNMYTN
ncbi:unnamed protein product [Ambrosiozyma monospora]|uniref:Unnamed protein product n=1 Tax=Ambrosiozyma monospora TaxID=43982 RepID=A0A9W6YNL5_AMBMO|nr:unnamed protein product [Ambrosiozyma monospora]